MWRDVGAVEIDHADVVRDRPHRIVRALADHRRGVGAALLERHVLRRSGVRDGLEIAQCLLRVGDDRLGVLRHRGARQVREADCDESQFFTTENSS